MLVKLEENRAKTWIIMDFTERYGNIGETHHGWMRDDDMIRIVRRSRSLIWILGQSQLHKMKWDEKVPWIHSIPESKSNRAQTNLAGCIPTVIGVVAAWLRWAAWCYAGTAGAAAAAPECRGTSGECQLPRVSVDARCQYQFLFENCEYVSLTSQVAMLLMRMWMMMMMMMMMMVQWRRRWTAKFRYHYTSKVCGRPQPSRRWWGRARSVSTQRTVLIFHLGVPVAILGHMISTLEQHVPATFANTPEGNGDTIHVRTNMNDMNLRLRSKAWRDRNRGFFPIQHPSAMSLKFLLSWASGEAQTLEMIRNNKKERFVIVRFSLTLTV